MRVTPCEMHRQKAADFERRAQETTTPEELAPFKTEMAALLAEIRKCPACVVHVGPPRTAEDFPPGYFEAFGKMAEAARRWLLVNDVGALLFRLPPVECMLIAEIPTAIDRLSGNDATRRFAEYLDHESGRQGTAFHLCILVREIGLPFEEWTAAELEQLKRESERMPEA